MRSGVRGPGGRQGRGVAKSVFASSAEACACWCSLPRVQSLTCVLALCSWLALSSVKEVEDVRVHMASTHSSADQIAQTATHQMPADGVHSAQRYRDRFCVSGESFCPRVCASVSVPTARRPQRIKHTANLEKFVPSLLGLMTQSKRFSKVVWPLACPARAQTHCVPPGRVC